MLTLAIEAAEAAGALVLRYFEMADFEREEKDNKTFVTNADKEAEKVIVALIQDRYPDHGIMGEEGSEMRPDAEYQWIIDPIDGTMNFLHGIPLFSVTITVVRNGTPIVGVIYNPVSRSLYTVEAGKGAAHNGKKMTVSDEKADIAGIFTTGHAMKEKERARKIYAAAGPFFKSGRVFSACALELAYLASGAIEAYICLGLNKWDYAAGWLMVKEAGGKITDYEGKESNFSESYFVASNCITHDAALGLVQSVES